MSVKERVRGVCEGESARCLGRRECEVSVKERVRGVCEGESARCLCVLVVWLTTSAPIGNW